MEEKKVVQEILEGQSPESTEAKVQETKESPEEQQSAEEKAGDQIKSEPDTSEKTTEKTGSKKKDQPEDFDLSALLPETVEEVIQFNILQMREWAYIFMGLIPHPKTKKVSPDMRQAKIAIDSATAMFDVVAPHLNDKLQREFKVMLSDLKMNFISKAGQAG